MDPSTNFIKLKSARIAMILSEDDAADVEQPIYAECVGVVGAMELTIQTPLVRVEN